MSDFDIARACAVGVDRDELDAAELILDHPVHGVAATATNADHLHSGGLNDALFQLENHGLFPRPSSEEVLEPPFHRSKHLLDGRRLPCAGPEPSAHRDLAGAVEHQPGRYRHPR